jgi:hypothetical protein
MYVKVNGYGGVAWRTVDDEWEPEEYEDYDENGDMVFMETTNPNEGMICCVMVGDDTLFYFDPDDVTKLEEDFCLGCGQIGCGHTSAMEYYGEEF